MIEHLWNLSESELLLTTAELSVAFAGFASLASILGRRRGQAGSGIDAGRLLNMLTASLSVTALAMAPIIPMLLAWPPRWVWGASGGAGLVAAVFVGRIVVRRASEMRRYPGYDPTANAMNLTLGAVALLGLVCSLLGLPPGNTFASYFGSLVAMLGVCGILFFRVIASLLHFEESASD